MSERFEIDPDEPFRNLRKYGTMWGSGLDALDTKLYRKVEEETMLEPDLDLSPEFDRLNALRFAASMRGAKNEDECVAWMVMRQYAFEHDGQVVLSDTGREYADAVMADQLRSDDERPTPTPAPEGLVKLAAWAVLALSLMVVVRRRH